MRDFNEDYSGARNDQHLVELWLSGRPETTQRVYRYGADKFLGFLGSDGIRDATVAIVVAYVKQLTGAPATQAKMTTIVKSLLSYAHRTGYTVFNVGKPIKCQKLPNKLHERIMDEESVADMIRAAGQGRDRALVRFFYTSGCRVSEVSQLSWKDLQGRRVTVDGKGTKTRTILIPQDVADEMRRLRGSDEPDTAAVFKSFRGTRLSARSLRYVIGQIAEEAGHKLSPHWFRHAHASHALDNGAPVHLVQRCLGHENVSSTSRYLHARPNEGASDYLSP